MSEAPTPQVTGFERTWGDLRAVNLLRWALCLLLFGLATTEDPQQIMTGIIPDMLVPIAVLFLLTALSFSVMLSSRQPSLSTQIYLQAWMDLLLLTSLLYITGGVDGGLAVLLVTGVVGTCTLLPRRIAMGLAVIAIFALWAEESTRELQGLVPGADFARTGVLSAIILMGSFASNALALRWRESADLAQRKLLDLANLEQLNEQILQHMSIGVLVVDHGGRIRQYNEAARQQLDLAAQATDALVTSASPALAEAWRNWLQRSETEGDGATLKRDKYLLQPHFLRLGAYEPAATLIFLEDMNAVHHRVQQIKQAALGRLTASIAHEIRNPLSAITHSSQLLGEWRNSPMEESQLLRMIDKNCVRIDRIIDDILSLSKQREIQPTSITLRAWLEELAVDYRMQKPELNLLLDFSKVGADISVRFDPLHLQQIIINLWDNAARYARPENGDPPRVQHRAWHLPNLNTTHMDVRDNGQGIPSDEINQVFEPFFTRQSQGTGLGLYIARELCECNHAHIELRQEPEMGACFQISFMETWQQAPQ